MSELCGEYSLDGAFCQKTKEIKPTGVCVQEELSLQLFQL